MIPLYANDLQFSSLSWVGMIGFVVLILFLVGFSVPDLGSSSLHLIKLDSCSSVYIKVCLFVCGYRMFCSLISFRSYISLNPLREAICECLFHIFLYNCCRRIEYNLWFIYVSLLPYDPRKEITKISNHSHKEQQIQTL